MDRALKAAQEDLAFQRFLSKSFGVYGTVEKDGYIFYGYLFRDIVYPVKKEKKLVEPPKPKWN